MCFFTLKHYKYTNEVNNFKIKIHFFVLSSKNRLCFQYCTSIVFTTVFINFFQYVLVVLEYSLC